MAYKINEDLYIGNTNKQLKDLLNGDTLPIGAIVDFDGSTIPDGYARYVDPDVMSETILFDTNIWDSMMKRYETKNIDFTPYTYVEVHFTGQGGTNATNTILKIDLTKPFKSVITNSSVSYSYGTSICYPDIQLLQGSNNDSGIFRIGACISTDKKKIWMGDPGYFTGQTNSGNFDANSVYNRISKIVGFKPTIRIKKTQQPSDYPSNQIHDAYSTSTTDTYSCNYINEVNIKHIASISCKKFTSTNKKTYIPADNSILLGSKLTISNNKIIVGSGVSRVKVSGNATFITSDTNYTMNVEIDLHVNQIEVKRAINYAGVTRYAFCSFSETIINVAEGDEIQLQVWNNSAGNYSIDGKGTWLTVEVIE